MTSLRLPALVLAGLLALPATLISQTCLGLPSFSRGPANLRGTYEDGQGASAIGAGLQFGGRSVFAGVSAVRFTYDGFDESGYGVSANLGTQLPLGAGKKASLCPVVSGSLGFGPDFDYLGDQVEIRNRSVTAGLALGFVVDAGESFRVVPNFNGGVVAGGTKISVNGAAFQGTDTYGFVGAGLGLMFGGSFGITPFVNLPVGLDDIDPSFGVHISLALGGRR